LEQESYFVLEYLSTGVWIVAAQTPNFGIERDHVAGAIKHNQTDRQVFERGRQTRIGPVGDLGAHRGLQDCCKLGCEQPKELNMFSRTESRRRKTNCQGPH
jgi:hypothetical protein